MDGPLYLYNKKQLKMGNCNDHKIFVEVNSCGSNNSSSSLGFQEFIWNGGDSNIFTLPVTPKEIHQVFLNGQKLRNAEGVDYTRLSNKVTVNYELFPITAIELKWVVTISYFK